MKTIYLIKPQNNLDILKHTLTTNLLKAKSEDSFVYILNINNDNALSKYVRSNFKPSLNNETLVLTEELDFEDLFKKIDVEYIVELEESEFIGKVAKEVKDLDLDTVLTRAKTKACRKQLFITNGYSVPDGPKVVISKDKSIPIGG